MNCEFCVDYRVLDSVMAGDWICIRYRSTFSLPARYIRDILT